MPKLKRTALLALVVIVALVPVSAGGAGLYMRLSLPTRSGRLTIAGLQAPVEVIRDRWSVPHIYAQNDDDLFFAQGYVQAQDRLWQMDLCRHAARGTLAEILGERAVGSDRLVRTLGLAQDAQQEWQRLDPVSQRALETFARGVNAFISEPHGRLPLEFSLLGCKPEPWQPVDSLAWARLLAWSLSAGWEPELLRARLVQAVGPQRAAELDSPDGKALHIPSELADLSALGRPILLEDAGTEWPWASSNGLGGLAWVSSAAGAGSGAPVLANTVQWPAQMPALCYEMHLAGGSYDVIGATVPGLPGVWVGRNRSMAWGGTGAWGDATDLYVERARPGNPLQVEYEGQWEDVRVREETIRVRGQSDPVSLLVLVTRHGSLVSDPHDEKQEQLALRWAGTGQPIGLVPGLLAVNRASTWDEFLGALGGWTVPAQVMTYADVAGNTGYAVAGALPGRSQGDGSYPVPGWTGGYEWMDPIPTVALPRALNPTGAAIAAIAGSLVSTDAGGGSADGALRSPAGPAAELLGGQARPTAEKLQALLADDRGPSRPLLVQLLEVPAKGWIQERTVPYLRAWDLRYDAESAGAGIYEAFHWRLAHNTLDDDLGAGLVDAYLNANPDHVAVMERLSREPAGEWFDDTRTADRESREDILSRSFAEGIDLLGRRFGDLPYEWNWGRVHNITLRHALGERWPLTLLLNRGAMRAGGGPACINATASDYGQRMTVRAVPSYRLVIDLGGQAVSMNTSGQSGDPFSPHYADMIQPWREGRYHPLLYDRQAILKAKEGLLTLLPAR